MPLAKDPPGLAHGSASSRSAPWAWVTHVAVVQWGRTYAEALRSVCCRAFPKAEIQAYGTGGEVLAALRAKPVDLLLQTLMFPDMDGVDLLKTVTQEKLARRAGLPARLIRSTAKAATEGESIPPLRETPTGVELRRRASTASPSTEARCSAYSSSRL